ncbi:chaperonin [Burkholderia phage BcepSauron]|uniref:Chaperonin n=1 Tax=Burkholderia phage BcepSauron TaxID=2530033 RepID=A0A482MMU4_9CAUD|nr:chaperonin [Burkholderia phage BcepSauron]QBQ74592.1 chaperonin [Burkholderia phage BcepSauron]
MPIKPLYDKVVVRTTDTDRTTVGGIVIPAASLKANQAVVVAVGDGHLMQDGTLRPLSVKAGDVVYLSHEGSEIEVNGEKLRVFIEGDLIGVLN